jgi:hypothetical protein
MSRRPRRNHAPGFKAKVALAAIKGDRTLSSTFIPIRSQRGKRSSRTGLRIFLARTALRRRNRQSM